MHFMNSASSLISDASGLLALFLVLFATGLILKRRFSANITKLTLLVLCALAVMMDLNSPNWLAADFPYAWLGFFLPMYALFLGRFPEKLLVFCAQLFAGSALACLCALIAKEIFPAAGIERECTRLILLIAFGGGYMYWLSSSGRKFSRELFSREDGWMGAVYAFGPCLVMALLPMIPRAGQPVDPMLAPLLVLLAIWSLAVLVMGILALHMRSRADFDLTLARGLLSANQEQAKDLIKVLECSRILRHDLKHHLHAVQMLLETGHVEEARKHLLEAGAKINEVTFTTFCENQVVNALLMSYSQRSQEAGIDFFASAQLPRESFMDNFELCSLIGNLLENALEACQKAPQGQRRITLKAAPHNGQLLISVENGFDGTIFREEGQIVSRKGKCGGLGIRSIRSIVSRHQGEYVPQWNENTFTASVMLRM
jgi:hypothetical protein